jgi:hypothetical protein
MHFLPRLFWIIFVITMGIYISMLVWSLPTISAAAGGLMPFDMRPSGYSFDEAKAFLAALPAETNNFYRQVQIGILDTAYPALLGATLFLAIGLLAQDWLKLGAWVIALIAIPGAVFDYMENASVKLMLFLGPENINAEIVEQACARSVSKALFTSAAMSIFLVLLAVWAIIWLRKRRKISEA